MEHNIVRYTNIYRRANDVGVMCGSFFETEECAKDHVSPFGESRYIGTVRVEIPIPEEEK